MAYYCEYDKIHLDDTFHFKEAFEVIDLSNCHDYEEN